MPLIVNGQRIEDAVIDSEFAGIKAYHENLGNVSCCERDPEFRGMARQNVIARVLLSQEAGRRIEPTPDAEVDAAVDKLKEEYGGEQWFFARTGLTPETIHLLRHDVDLDLRVRRMMDRLADEDGPPGDETLRRHYAQHLDAFKTAEEVRASHILKNPPRGEDRQGSYETLREVRRQLLAGADFDDLARQHSDKADEHIDLGHFKKNELAPEFETVAFSMNVGEISPIFVSPYGFHLVKLTDRKPSVPKPFEEIRDEVASHYREWLKQEKVRALVKELEGRAVVEEVTESEEAPVV
jgi:parvulin-like peptidyl-prolyl isomerase